MRLYVGGIRFPVVPKEAGEQDIRWAKLKSTGYLRPTSPTLALYVLAMRCPVLAMLGPGISYALFWYLALRTMPCPGTCDALIPCTLKSNTINRIPGSNCTKIAVSCLGTSGGADVLVLGARSKRLCGPIRATSH
eukprot:3566148-Rhodomonas_salina.1